MAPIFPISPSSPGQLIVPADTIGSAGAPQGGFGAILEKGLADVEAKVGQADKLVQAYARGDTIPVHQVTLALEQARVAVELAVQVRTRLVETYREFMSMQL